MGKAAGLWRAIWAGSPDDWAAWQAYLRCALAACGQAAATTGVGGAGRDGGAAAGGDRAAACPAAQVCTFVLAGSCCALAEVKSWNMQRVDLS